MTTPRSFSSSLAKYFLALGILAPALTSANQSNEVGLGLADIRDVDDQFIGVYYTRYLEPVDTKTGPLSLSPYLHRADSITGRYFGIHDNDRYELGGQMFVGNEWHFTGNVRYIDSDRFADSDYKSVDLRAGYFLSADWQVGAGVLYEREENDYHYFDGQSWQAGTASRTEFLPSIFTRYTQIKNGEGWDVAAQVTLSDYDTAELSGQYFFSPRFSLFSTYTYRNNRDEFEDDTHLLEAGADYWFTPSFSTRFGLGTRLNGGDRIESVTLLASYRF